MYLWFANYWQTMHNAVTKQNKTKQNKVFASFHLCAVIIFVFCTLSVFSNSYYISHSQNLFHCFYALGQQCYFVCDTVVLQTMVSGMKHSLLECLEVCDIQLLCNGAAEYVHSLYICYWTLHFLLTLKVCVIVYYKLCAIFEPFGGVLHI